VVITCYHNLKGLKAAGLSWILSVVMLFQIFSTPCHAQAAVYLNVHSITTTSAKIEGALDNDREIARDTNGNPIYRIRFFIINLSGTPSYSSDLGTSGEWALSIYNRSASALSPGGSYRVSAWAERTYNNGVSWSQEPTSGTDFYFTTVPNPPGGLDSVAGVTGNNDNSTFYFWPPTVGPVTGYTLQHSSSAGNQSLNFSEGSWDPGTFKNLTFPTQGNRTYSVKVRAYNSGGPGPWSETREFTTLAGLPRNLRATPTTTTANFSWSAPTNTVTSSLTYRVSYSADAGSNVYEGNWSTDVFVTGTQYTFTGLTADTPY